MFVEFVPLLLVLCLLPFLLCLQKECFIIWGIVVGHAVRRVLSGVGVKPIWPTLWLVFNKVR